MTQVKTAATTKVLIAMVGGASMLSWFLPTGATAILLQRDGVTLDRTVYGNIPYLRTVVAPAIRREPTTEEDITTASSSSSTSASNHIFDWDDICQQIVRGVERYDLSIREPCETACDGVSLLP